LKRDAYHHGDLRETLIALAIETLARGGPETLALRNLAERAGVSGMAPYRHFKDRAELLEAVARHGFEILRGELVAVDDPSDARKALVAFGVVYVRFACARPGLFQVMFGGAPPTPDEDLSADGSTVYGLFLSKIARAVGAERRMDAFLACWCVVHGLACLAIAGRLRGSSEAPETLAARLGELVLGCLAA